MHLIKVRAYKRAIIALHIGTAPLPQVAWIVSHT